ncbi:MAG: hypothetical protein ACRDTG_31740 [Pseudonocardiaceae bacterium]
MIRARPWSSRPPGQSNWDTLWPKLVKAAQSTSNPERGAIDDHQYDLLRQTGIFRALIPHEYKGHAVDPLAALTLIEDLASVSGTLGWLAFTGTIGGMFSVELPDVGVGEVYSDPDELIAYAGGIHGELSRRGGVFTVSGYWHMVSGVSRAPWVAVGCTVVNAEPSATAVVLIPRAACEIGPYWSPVGLPGTGTAPLTVRDVAVPAHRVAYDVRSDSVNRRRRLFRVLVPSAIAAVSVGIGLASLDAAAEHLAHEQPGTGARRADSELIQDVLGRHYAQMLAARSLLHEVTSEVWQRAANGDDLGLELGARHRLAATHAAHAAAAAAETITRLAGVAAVTNGHLASVRWLDARTILANITVRDLYYRVYGGVTAEGDIPRSWP